MAMYMAVRGMDIGVVGVGHWSGSLDAGVSVEGRWMITQGEIYARDGYNTG